jgi:hypothetical protein
MRQAVTGVNAEQDSKRKMRTPTRRYLGEGSNAWGRFDRRIQAVHRGNGDGMLRKGCWATGEIRRVGIATRTHSSGGGRGGSRRGP